MLIWLSIWCLFGASIFGMLTSSLLWSKAARDRVVKIWLITTEKVESKDLDVQRKLLFDELSSRLLLTKSGQLSQLKLLTWSVLSAVLFTIAIYLLDSSRTGGASVPGFLQILPISALNHYLIESVFSSHFIKRYESLVGKNLWIESVWRSISHGLLGILKIVALLAITTVILVTAVDLVRPLFEIDVFPLWKPSQIGLGTLANGPTFLLFHQMVGTSSDHLHLGVAETVLLVASVCSSLVLMFCAFMVALITNSSALLRVLSTVAERLDSTDPRILLAVSLSTFGLSTGLMQAYTFTSP